MRKNIFNIDINAISNNVFIQTDGYDKQPKLTTSKKKMLIFKMVYKKNPITTGSMTTTILASTTTITIAP